jgi:hypothetical protein
MRSQKTTHEKRTDHRSAVIGLDDLNPNLGYSACARVMEASLISR